MNQALFLPGELMIDPGAQDLINQGVDLIEFLKRHVTGDWGDIGEDDKAENDFSVTRDLRILSAYETSAGRLWIITEADRSATTFFCLRNIENEPICRF